MSFSVDVSESQPEEGDADQRTLYKCEGHIELDGRECAVETEWVESEFEAKLEAERIIDAAIAVAAKDMQHRKSDFLDELGRFW